MLPLHIRERLAQAKKARTSERPTYTIPTFPPSVDPGGHEMRDFAVNDDLRPIPHTLPGITPYLGLRARLSQIWINKWTILLLLVLIRTILAVRSLNDNLESARKEALVACHDVESIGSAMASMPHYMSQGVNEITAHGVERAVNGLMHMLLLSVSAVEEIVVFIINLLTSTYVCLITLVVSGALHVALKVADDVGNFINKTVGDIGKGIHKDIDAFQADLNKFTGALNGIPKLFGSSSTIPTINVDDSLGKLDHLQLPGNIDQGLAKLNSSIPTFDQVQNFTNSIIRKPFEIVKTQLNQSLHTYQFDRSVFPVPQKEQMKFCSENSAINDFFLRLVKVALLLKKIFIVVICLLATLVCVPMAYREIWRWRTTQKRAQLLSNHAFDPLDVVQIASRPYSSTVGIKAASKFRSTRQQILVRWFFSYATTVPALFVLTLGLAGLAGCFCQWIILRMVEKEVPALAHDVGDFAGKVVSKLNVASQQWALGTNKVIESTNTDINQQVFGWVNTTTGAVNDTLNAFVDQMSDALNFTFGGTVLYEPITGVLNCLIGLKIAGIEKGLTWVSDHAHVNFPELPNNTFSIGAAASLSDDPAFKSKADSFLADPGSKAKDKISNTLVKLTDKIADHIRTEAIISACVVMIWVAIVVIGLISTIIRFCGREKLHGEGGEPCDEAFLDDAGHQHLTSRVVPPVYTKEEQSGGERIRREMPLDESGLSPSEKLGYAGERSAAVVGPGPGRVSSHGVLYQKR